MKKNDSQQQGSTALLTLFGIFAGAGFALLFLNLTRYAAARGAVQEAARQTARCISPTDGKCVSVSASGPLPISDWYGYAPELTADVYAREADYSLEVPQTRFDLPITTYEIRSERHAVTWPEFSVPVRRYVGMMNSWAILRGDVAAKFQLPGSTPIFTCVFPDAVEVAWGLNFRTPATYFSDAWCRLYGSAGAVSGNDLAAALLQGKVSCTNDQGSPVQIDAISARGATLFRGDPNWGNAPCSLRLPGAPLTKSSAPSEIEPWLRLGGTPVCDAPETLSTPLANFREPASRIGETNRPFPITVERQYLVVEVPVCDEKSVQAEITAKLSAFNSDDLKRVGDIFASPGRIASPGFDVLDFNADSRFNLNSAFLFPPADPRTGLLTAILPAAYNWTYLRWERFANREDARGGAPLQAEKTLLERRVCYWKEWNAAQKEHWTGLSSVAPPPSEIRIPRLSQAAACPAARRLVPSPQYICRNRISSAPSGAFEKCGGWKEQQALLRQRYDRALLDLHERLRHLNFEHLESLPRAELFGSEIAAAWSDERFDVAWEFAWSAVDSSGNPVPAGYARPRPAQQISITEPLRQIPNEFAPGADQWIAAILKQIGAKVSDPGWKQFEQQVSAALPAAVRRTAADPIVIGNLNPFPLPPEFGLERQGIEIAAFSPARDAFDYDLDCSPDGQCPVPDPGAEFKNLEELLLPLAAESLPQVGAGERLALRAIASINPEFTYLGQYSLPELKKLRDKLPACAAVIANCRSGREAAHAVPEFLSRQQALPEACITGTVADCFSVPISEGEPAGEINVQTDLERARKAGHAELSRIFPGVEVRERCSSSGCAEIEIDTSSSESVSVGVTYYLGLEFPLDSILQRKFLPITAGTTETLERTVVGRRPAEAVEKSVGP